MKTRPWDRRTNESAAAHGAFLIYRDLGPDRTFEKTCEELVRKPSYRRQLSRWSSEHDWPERVAAWDAYLQRVRDGVIVDEVVQAQARLRSRAGELVDRLVDVALGTVEYEHDDEGKPINPVTGAHVRALLGAIDRAGITVVTRVDHTSKGDAIGQPLNPATLSDAALAEVAAQLGIDEDEEGETP